MTSIPPTPRFRLREATADDTLACATICAKAFETVDEAAVVFPQAEQNRPAHVEARYNQFTDTGSSDLQWTLACDDTSREAVGFLRWCVVEQGVDDEDARRQASIERSMSYKWDALQHNEERCRGTLLRAYATTAYDAHRDYLRQYGRHAYVLNVATDPQRQRTGAAALLLADFCSKVDALGIPAFLVATSVAVRLYNRFGFATLCEIVVSADGVSFVLIVMHRPAY